MRIALVALLALLLPACGSKTEETAAARHSTATTTHTAGEDEVAAVLESAGTPLAKVRFVIDSRPVAGTPFNLKLVVSAAGPVPQLVVTAESGDFRIDPASMALPLNEAEAQSGIGREFRGSHDFSATAQHDGLTQVNVHLTTEPDVPETLYVIPVLVSKPGAPNAAGAPASDKPDPAAAGNHG